MIILQLLYTGKQEEKDKKEPGHGSERIFSSLLVLVSMLHDKLLVFHLNCRPDADKHAVHKSIALSYTRVFVSVIEPTGLRNVSGSSVQNKQLSVGNIV